MTDNSFLPSGQTIDLGPMTIFIVTNNGVLNHLNNYYRGLHSSAKRPEQVRIAWKTFFMYEFVCK